MLYIYIKITINDDHLDPSMKVCNGRDRENHPVS